MVCWANGVVSAYEPEKREMRCPTRKHEHCNSEHKQHFSLSHPAFAASHNPTCSPSPIIAFHDS